jgi:hypothetical protein
MSAIDAGFEAEKSPMGVECSSDMTLLKGRSKPP